MKQLKQQHVLATSMTLPAVRTLVAVVHNNSEREVIPVLAIVTRTIESWCHATSEEVGVVIVRDGWPTTLYAADELRGDGAAEVVACDWDEESDELMFSYVFRRLEQRHEAATTKKRPAKST